MKLSMLFLPCSIVTITAAFQSTTNRIQIQRVVVRRGRRCSCFNLDAPRSVLRYHDYHQGLKMNSGQSQDGDEEQEDDDDYIDDINLEDWRNFRKRLVETSERSTGSGDSSSSSSSATHSSRFKEDNLDHSNGEDDTRKPDAMAKITARPNSVSKANEELLQSQSDTLYSEGLWAHESSVAEVGGLLLRMPLEVEIYRNRDQLSIGRELKLRLEIDGAESNTKPFLSSSSTGAVNNKNPDLSFSLTAAQTLLWYKKTQSLIDDQMSDIARLADESGQINSFQLGSNDEEMLKLYLDNRQSWQEVCLVAERDVRNGDALTYVLNRPMAFSLNENLARLILFGAFNAMNDGKVSVSQMNLLTKFLRAFEQSCGVYIGGPDGMDQKAVLLHGIPDLHGAEEIAPGTRIFRGGLDAAIEGVLEGKYKPLDFRFMVGCHRYKNGELDRELNDCKHQPVACARALALKQCMQLPKPLWHEVMELCGGELREISRLELLKRDDIQD